MATACEEGTEKRPARGRYLAEYVRVTEGRPRGPAAARARRQRGQGVAPRRRLRWAEREGGRPVLVHR